MKVLNGLCDGEGERLHAHLNSIAVAWLLQGCTLFSVAEDFCIIWSHKKCSLHVYRTSVCAALGINGSANLRVTCNTTHLLGSFEIEEANYHLYYFGVDCYINGSQVSTPHIENQVTAYVI